MISTFLRTTSLALLCITFAAGFLGAADDTYPEKAIRFYVPYGPGGASDLSARTLSKIIPEFLGAQLVVINKPGASGSTCFNYIRESKPDGYEMMMDTGGACTTYAAKNPNLPYKYSDHTYVALVQVNDHGIAVRRNTWKSFDEFAKYLRDNPGKLKYSTAGNGTAQHIGGLDVLRGLGLPVNQARAVHYDSANEAVLALVQGEVDFTVNNFPGMKGFLTDGSIHLLATTGSTRIEDYPDVPTTAELGYPDINTRSWVGVGGPPGLPKYVIEKWDAAVEKALKTKEWKAFSEKLNFRTTFLNSKEYTEFADKDFNKLRQMFEAIK